MRLGSEVKKWEQERTPMLYIVSHLSCYQEQDQRRLWQQGDQG